MKKIGLSFVIIMSIIILSVPTIGMTQAQENGNQKKTVSPYENYISLNVIPNTSQDHWSGDGSTLVRTGTQREGPYNGPLGIGRMYSEAIISVTRFSIAPSGTPPTASGEGRAVYKEKYVIETGPYGAGTLEGICVMQWESNTVEEPKFYDFMGYSIFAHGTGGLDGIKLIYQTTGSALPAGPGLPPPPSYQVGTITLPK